MSMTPITLANLTRALNKLKDYFVQIKDAVRSVNGVTPDTSGDITIDHVDFATDLESFSTRYNSGDYIQRTSGGTASIKDGDGWLVAIKGHAVKTGYVEEQLNMTVNAIPREEGVESITAEIDRDTFVEAVTQSGTITLTYTTDWSEDPAGYGVTVTGTPIAGDQIVIVYVKGERGLITFSDPRTFVSTGWNLYKESSEYSGYSGYAKVVRYSDTYGYRISGSYTSIQYSATLTSTKSAVTVTSGNFTVPADGYIWITGGNSTDTAIYMTWTDWTEGYKWDGEAQGEFSAYSETVIDLTELFEAADCPFPYGLLACGSAQDEINLNIGQAISRVERMAYSEANLAIAEASGREYDYDENYIYLVRATAVTSVVEIDGGYTVSDHGLEFFTNTTVPVFAQSIYGSSLKNKLERDVITISQQDLTSGEQSQVRTNIGAASAADVSDLSGKITNLKTVKTYTWTATTNANGVIGIPQGACKPSKQNLLAIYCGNGAYGCLRTDSVASDLYAFQVISLVSSTYTRIVNTELTYTIAYIDL